MASRQQIKSRIKSVKNTRQITKAMQLVAASKLRRSQDAAERPAVYARLARQMLTRLRQLDGAEQFTWFNVRPVKKRYLVVIASNLGLAGAYDGNIIRQLIVEVKMDREAGIETSIICIGRKVGHAAARIADLHIEAIYDALPEHPNSDDLRPLLGQIVGHFADGEADAVDLIYTHYISTINTVAAIQRVLPAGFHEEELSDQLSIAEAEPSPLLLLEAVTLQLLESQLYQAVLEAIASEQSMRMLAMKSATDNAGGIIDDLTLAFNNARQAAITQELAEISGGAEALNG
jgi:F-type H+-transporting ATPase subunit gamma